MQRQINELIASAAFGDAVRNAGLRNVQITLHNPGRGLAYVTGERTDGMAFDLEMSLSGVFEEPESAGAIVAAVMNDLRHVP